MISITIKISNIDYEETLRKIFPALKEKLHSLESTDMVIRLLQKLDDAAMPILLGIMERLPQGTKDDFLAMCLNTYSGKICEKLNGELAKHPYGKFLDVKKISIIKEQESLYLWFRQVQVDYKGLVKEKITGRLGGVASLFAGERLEKMALELLWNEDSKKKMIGLAQNSLDKYGLVMELGDIQIFRGKEVPLNTIDAEKSLELTNEMTEDMLDALAGYLKDKTEENDIPKREGDLNLQKLTALYDGTPINTNLPEEKRLAIACKEGDESAMFKMAYLMRNRCGQEETKLMERYENEPSPEYANDICLMKGLSQWAEAYMMWLIRAALYGNTAAAALLDRCPLYKNFAYIPYDMMIGKGRGAITIWDSTSLSEIGFTDVPKGHTDCKLYYDSDKRIFDLRYVSYYEPPDEDGFGAEWEYSDIYFDEFFCLLPKKP